MDYKKIVILRFSSIGDIVLTLPTIRALRAQYPEAQITFVTKAPFASLFEAVEEIDSVIPLSKEKGALKKIIEHCQKEQYDLLVDLHSNQRTLLLKLLGRAKKCITYKKPRLSKLLLVWFKKKPDPLIPIWKRYLQTVKPLLTKETRPNFSLTLSKNATQKATEIIAPLEKNIITIASGSSWATKEWPIEKYHQLGKLLATLKNVSIITIGGEKDKTVQTALQKSIPSLVPLCGELSIVESAAIVAQSTMLLTVDTGMMHIGAGYNTPICALFGSTVKDFGFFPASQNCTIFEKELSCRPCSHTGKVVCPKKHFRCMNEINSETIFNTIKATLGV